MILSNCSKQYKDKTVLSDISLKLNSGIYHLTGKNGSGKSVFCRCLLGLEQFTEGSTEEMPKHVLFLPDTPLGEDWLTLRENLELLLYYYGISLSEEEKAAYMEKLRITEPNENYHKVSVGTSMKIGLFFLLLKKHWGLIILDETMSHLDKVIRETIWDELEQRAREGTIVILVDHSFPGRSGQLWYTLDMEEINGNQ
ncbi:MAG: ATP-binding cassette domain-containing protein [Lachnospiraceae bacterium]|jgi:ABC-2 type transport system ATP-binding protein|nr:ATP-binding cassette domain-containing protein [Lachnospiraceae bacterium]MEE3460825.1 ATP-binding cassette domain-containing protein [Lachnospiraceae bacterium]